MRKLNLDSLAHLTYCFIRIINLRWCTLLTLLNSKWWGVQLSSGCVFFR